MTLKEIQNEHKEWVDRNFGEDRPAWHALLGLVEEVGELAHSYLKREQNIRGTKAEHTAKIKDAVGDIVIYLLDFCNKEGLDLTDVTKDVWDHVKNRDWRAEREHNSAENRINDIMFIIDKYRYNNVATEKELQDDIAEAFLKNDIQFTREYQVNEESRPDFYINGIGVEIKIKGSASQLLRQIHRYLTAEKIEGMVVVTTRSVLADIPAEINGKPVRTIHLLSL